MPTIRTTNGTEMNVSQEAWDSVYSKRPEKYSLVSGGGATSTTSSKSSDSQINQLYQQYVGRNATSAELANWRNETPQSLDSFLQKDVATWKAQNQSSTTPTQTSPTVDQTGWTDSMKQSFAVLTEKVDRMVKSGQTVNPDIVIDDATITRFTEQAKSELTPYYRQLFTQTEADLKNAMEQTQQSYERTIGDIGRSYGAALENTQEDFGQRGLQFSSDRTKSEASIATGANRAIEDATTAAEQQARTIGTTAERKLGSSAFPSLDTTVTADRRLQTGVAGQFGLTGGSSRSLFTATGGQTGSLQTDQTYAEKQRLNELTSAERELRSLNVQ